MAKHSFVFAALALAASACTDLPSDVPDDGLVLSVVETDHVAGTFHTGDTSLAFDFARDDAGHHASVWNDSGELIVASDLQGLFETQRFGSNDELVLSGPIGRPTSIAGDTHRLTGPELLHVGELRETLAARADVNAELVSPPNPYDTVSAAYWGSDRMLHLGPGETGKLGTQPFWWRTAVQTRSFAPHCLTITFTAGLSFEMHVVLPNQYTTFYGYWWAQWLYVQNLNSWVDYSAYGLGVCGPGELGVVTYYGN
jgi:hypothetical protein